ncbi:MAG: DUF2075 domain-containing protein [Gemmatimonadetes bacterium]|nr:MAG: DUF2075 domain-containing protein [Gemmatimonadota bacterium]
MLEQFWGLSSKPFLNTPSLDFLFESSEFSESYARLWYNMQDLRGGICVVTGEIGTGKTMLSRALLNKLNGDDRFSTALVLNPQLTPNQLIKLILTEFGAVKKPARSKYQLLEQLNGFLLEEYEQGRTPVVLIDEAQMLKKPLLEELRLMTNFETNTTKLIQVVLFGQPELNKIINRIPQFKQRIAIRYHIEPLDLDETTAYIKHRLQCAGVSLESVFSADSLEKVFQYTGGIPRVINTLCMNALMAGFIRHTRPITAELVQDVWADLEGR